MREITSILLLRDGNFLSQFITKLTPSFEPAAEILPDWRLVAWLLLPPPLRRWNIPPSWCISHCLVWCPMRASVRLFSCLSLKGSPTIVYWGAVCDCARMGDIPSLTGSDLAVSEAALWFKRTFWEFFRLCVCVEVFISMLLAWWFWWVEGCLNSSGCRSTH